MRITLQHRHDTPHADLGDAIARRALRRLGRIADRIAGLAVSLVDLNGPKGGVDRQCQVGARLRDGRHRLISPSVQRGLKRGMVVPPTTGALPCCTAT